MAAYTLAPKRCLLLKTPQDGGAAVLKEGAAVGARAGECYACLLLFDANSLARYAAEGLFTAAHLVLGRDAAAVAARMIPGRLDALPEDAVTLAQLKALMLPGWGQDCALSGENALCGAILSGMHGGAVNALLLAPAGLGAGGFTRIEKAELRLTVGGGMQAPVWRRSVSAGDVVSGAENSHQADLEELRHYVNARRMEVSLPFMTWGALQNGLFAHWADMILRLRAHLNEALEKAGRPLPAYSALAAGDYPQAAKIGELRRAIEEQPDAKTCLIWESAFASALSLETHPGWKIDETVRYSWNARSPLCGTYYEYVRQEDGSYRQMKYFQLGYWVLQNAAGIAGALQGKTVTGARLLLTRRAVNNRDNKAHQALVYGVTLAQRPQGVMSVGDIYTATVCAADTLEAGQSKELVLTDAAIKALQNGQIKGFGVREDSGVMPLESYARLTVEVEGA